MWELLGAPLDSVAKACDNAGEAFTGWEPSARPARERSESERLKTLASDHVNVRHRKFFAHAAHGSVGVAPNRTAALDEVAWDPAMPELSPDLLRLCVIATPVGDDVDRALDVLLAHIADRLPIEAVRAWTSAEEPSPHFAALQQCDAALVCGRRIPLSDEALARVQWYCERGRPLIVLGVGGASTFARWPQFDLEVLGMEAQGTLSPPRGPQLVAPLDRSHPILAGAGPLEIDDCPARGIRLADDVELLLECVENGASQPVAWTRRCGTSRVFATVLGQSGSLAAPGFAGLVSHALRWVTDSGSGV